MDDLKFNRGDWLGGHPSTYVFQSFLGEGTFGKVAKCLNTATMELVAVKIMKNQQAQICDAMREIDMLEWIKGLDKDKCAIVRWSGWFFHELHFCLKFELLHMSLREFLSIKGHLSLMMEDICTVLNQLAEALGLLQSKGVIHADLKPDNIMLVHESKPLKVKIIDFGLAWHVSEVGVDSGTRCYKAPELLLGLPLAGAIDVWAVGCTAFELFTGILMYPGHTDYQMLKYMSENQGPFPRHILDSGKKTTLFFNKGSLWTLKSPAEYLIETGVRTIGTKGYHLNSMDDLAKDGEPDVVRHFADLLKRMLQLDAGLRITPQDMLKHPFSITACSGNADHNSTSQGVSSPGDTATSPKGSIDVEGGAPQVPEELSYRSEGEWSASMELGGGNGVASSTGAMTGSLEAGERVTSAELSGSRGVSSPGDTATSPKGSIDAEGGAPQVPEELSYRSEGEWSASMELGGGNGVASSTGAMTESLEEGERVTSVELSGSRGVSSPGDTATSPKGSIDVEGGAPQVPEELSYRSEGEWSASMELGGGNGVASSTGAMTGSLEAGERVTSAELSGSRGVSSPGDTATSPKGSIDAEGGAPQVPEELSYRSEGEWSASMELSGGNGVASSTGAMTESLEEGERVTSVELSGSRGVSSPGDTATSPKGSIDVEGGAPQVPEELSYRSEGEWSASMELSGGNGDASNTGAMTESLEAGERVTSVELSGSRGVSSPGDTAGSPKGSIDAEGGAPQVSEELSYRSEGEWSASMELSGGNGDTSSTGAITESLEEGERGTSVELSGSSSCTDLALEYSGALTPVADVQQEVAKKRNKVKRFFVRLLKTLCCCCCCPTDDDQS